MFQEGRQATVPDKDSGALAFYGQVQLQGH